MDGFLFNDAQLDGPCDVPESCTGNSDTCTAPDNVKTNGSACDTGNSSGVCSAPDTCNGHDKACHDQYKGSDTVCRAAGMLANNMCFASSIPLLPLCDHDICMW